MFGSRLARRAGLLGALLLLPLTACNAARTTDTGLNADCAAPTLAVAGAPHPRLGHPLVVHPGETLRVNGRFFAAGCHDSGGSGRGSRDRPLASVQLVLQSLHHVGPVATAHPRGKRSEFVVQVIIPAATGAGPAKIFDAGGSARHAIRLVVRG
jgi:hypothetical protein